MNIDKIILNQAIVHYGVEAQLDQVIEECLELALAIRRYKREPSFSINIDAVIDEIADVSIMVAQAAIVVGPERVQKRVNYKLHRLQGRINKDVTETNFVNMTKTSEV